MRRRWLLGLLVAAWGCGSDTSTSALSDAQKEGPSGGAEPSAAGVAPTPQEKEVESDYEAPVATGNFVWIANPKSGRVAYVDAVTLVVKTALAGNGPTFLSAVPGQTDDATVVLNVLSEDATLMRATKTGITTKTLKTAPEANALAFSADGHFAIAWTDARKIASAPKTKGFQDLTIMNLVTGTSTILAVGYRPVLVGFAAGAPKAYAVTQDGIAVVDVSGTPVVTKNVAISDNPNDDPGTRDVSVTPDGHIALVRRDNSAEVTAVNLDTSTRTTVALPGFVTDLDLTENGTKAVAVIRDTSQVAILPIPGILTPPSTFSTIDVTGETIGSVSLAPGDSKALLYTNATAEERVTILDIAQTPPPLRTVRLYSPVLAVFSAPDAGHAVVLHDKTDGPDGTPGAFSLVPVAAALPAKIVATSAPPTAVASTNTRAIIAERSDSKKIYGAYLARMPELMVERYTLASPPIAVGVVPGAKRAFVAQEHPEGRLTFIDLDSGVARTLTGFELASRVVDGETPQ